jgi:hypothetical protein
MNFIFTVLGIITAFLTFVMILVDKERKLAYIPAVISFLSFNIMLALTYTIEPVITVKYYDNTTEVKVYGDDPNVFRIAKEKSCKVMMIYDRKGLFDLNDGEQVSFKKECENLSDFDKSQITHITEQLSKL